MKCRECEEYGIITKMQLDRDLGVYCCPVCEETVDANGVIIGEEDMGRPYEDIIAELES